MGHFCHGEQNERAVYWTKSCTPETNCFMNLDISMVLRWSLRLALEKNVA